MKNNVAVGFDVQESYEDLINEFNAETMTNFLNSIGVQQNIVPQYVGSFEKMVFIHGDSDEIYTSKEIKIIDSISYMIRYNDFYKISVKGGMTCSTFAFDVEEENDTEKVCVALMKITNKAFKNYNFFVFRTTKGLLLGSRVYMDNDEKDCILSQIISSYRMLEDITNQLWFSFPEENFVDFYSDTLDALCYENEVLDYDEQAKKRRGINFNYLDSLNEVARAYKIDLTFATCRYLDTFSDKVIEIPYKQLLDEIYEELSYIKSITANSLEVLLAAEELEKIASEVEEEYNASIAVTEEDFTNTLIDDSTKKLLENPEEMIKIMKKVKGI